MPMPRCTITHKNTNNLDVIQVNAGVLSFEIIPELGGKISSLKDLRTGREWLWKNPRITYKNMPHGSSYIAEADTGGWDECFPTISACNYPSAPWAGTALQDHGELWSQATSLDIREEGEKAILRSRWRGVALAYTFERTVTLCYASDSLLFEYAVSNHADSPIDFIWSAHPLLAIEPKMQLRLPPSARFNRTLAIPEGSITGDSDLRYPFSLNTGENEIDLTSLPEAFVAFAFKIWSNPLSAGWVTLQAEDGGFHLSWDVAQLPQVAVWMNIGAWAGDGGLPYYNLGLEPCIGAQDSLEEAVTKHHLFASIPPQDTHNWQLKIQLTEKQ